MKITEKTYQRLRMGEFIIKEYDNWILVMRAEQLVLGRISLINKNGFGNLGDLPDNEILEMRKIANEIETKLKSAFDYDKMNYQVLGLVDPEFALHILPRYSGPREWNGREFFDQGWPTPDYLKNKNDMTEEELKILCKYLYDLFK